MVIELMARLVSVKTVTHCTTACSALFAGFSDFELTGGNSSEEKDGGPDITISLALGPTGQTSYLLEDGRGKAVSSPFDSMFRAHRKQDSKRYQNVKSQV